MVIGVPIVNVTVQPGPAGPVTNVTIGTVTTLNAGTNATATLTGSAPNKQLNLGIPRGSGASIAAAVGGLTVANPPAAVNDVDFETASDSDLIALLLTMLLNLKSLS